MFRLNSFLYFFSLAKGLQMIGMNDVVALMVEILLAILALET